MLERDQTEHPSPADLQNYVNGKLDESPSVWIEEHLEDCDACCDKLAELERKNKNPVLKQVLERHPLNGSSAGSSMGSGGGSRLGRERRAATSQGQNLVVAQKLLPSDRYELLETISEGGMGVVWKAYDRILDRNIAVKTLRPEADSEGLRKRFEEETRISAQLNHPCIAAIYDLGELLDGRPFMAMKLIGGETFSKCIEQKEDRAQLLNAFVKLCECIGFAHSEGVVHRDLKPSNVMVGDFGEVQVMDWGLAKHLTNQSWRENRLPDVEICSDSESSDSANETETPPVSSGSDLTRKGSKYGRMPTRIGTVMGTPAYMSPEQAHGRTDVLDEQSDIFSLGAILCELLTGLPPYAVEDDDETLSMAKRHDIGPACRRLRERVEDLGLAELAIHCMAREPWQRPKSAGEVALAVEQWRDDIRTQLRESELARASGEARLREEKKRRRIQLFFAIATILFTGFFVKIWARHQNREAELSLREEQRAASLRMTTESELRQFEELMSSAVEKGDEAGSEWNSADIHLRRAEETNRRYSDERLSNQIQLAKNRFGKAKEAFEADQKLISDLQILDGLFSPKLMDDFSGVEPPGIEDIERLENSPGFRHQMMVRRSMFMSEVAAIGFREYGFGTDFSRPKDAAEYLATRPASFRADVLQRTHLWMQHSRISGFDDWFEWACELANLLDPSERNTRLRNGIRDRDVPFLAMMPGGANLDEYPPELLWAAALELRTQRSGFLMDFFEQAQLTHLDSPTINRDLAHQLQRSGRIEEATTYLMISAATQTDPDKKAWALFDVSKSLQQLEKYQQAVYLLKQAIQLSPGVVPDAKFAESVSPVSDYKFAIDVLKEMLDGGFVSDASCWIELGHFLMKDQQFNEAARAYKRAIEVGIWSAEKELEITEMLAVAESLSDSSR